MKKSTHKRLTAWLLTLALVVTLLPGMGMTALAAEDGGEGNGPPAVEVVAPEDESSGSDETVGTPPSTEPTPPALPESKEEDKTTEDEGDPSGSDYNVGADTQPQGPMRVPVMQAPMLAAETEEYPPIGVYNNIGADEYHSGMRDNTYLPNMESVDKDNEFVFLPHQGPSAPENYVLWYENGVLHMNGYTGGRIETKTGLLQPKPLEILVEADSTIRGSRFGCIRLNSGKGKFHSLIISSPNGKKLTLNLDVPHGEIAAITSYSGNNTQSNVTLQGSVVVEATVNSTATTGRVTAFGIEARDVAILEKASFKAVCTAVAPLNDGCAACGIVANGKLTVNTTGTIDINVSDVSADGRAYSIGLRGSSVDFQRVTYMAVKWTNGYAYDRGFAISPTTTVIANHAVCHPNQTDYTSAIYRYGVPRKVTLTDCDITSARDPLGRQLYTEGTFLFGDELTIEARNHGYPVMGWETNSITPNATTDPLKYQVHDDTENLTIKPLYRFGEEGGLSFEWTGSDTGQVRLKLFGVSNIPMEDIRLDVFGNANAAVVGEATYDYGNKMLLVPVGNLNTKSSYRLTVKNTSGTELYSEWFQPIPVDTPTIDKPSGYYYGSMNVNVTVPDSTEVFYKTSTAEIYSGSEGTAFSGDPIAVEGTDSSLTLRARKIKNGVAFWSTPVTATWTKLTELPAPKVTVRPQSGGEPLTPSGPNTYTIKEFVNVELTESGSWPLNATMAYAYNSSTSPQNAVPYTKPFEVRGEKTISVFTRVPKAGGGYDYKREDYTFKVDPSVKKVLLVVRDATAYDSDGNVLAASSDVNVSVGARIRVVPTVPSGKVFKNWSADGIYDTPNDKFKEELFFTMPDRSNNGNMLILGAEFADASEAYITGDTKVLLAMGSTQYNGNDVIMQGTVGDSVDLFTDQSAGVDYHALRTITYQWWEGDTVGEDEDALHEWATFDKSKTYTVKVTITAKGKFSDTAGVQFGPYGKFFKMKDVTRPYGGKSLTFTATPLREMKLTLPTLHEGDSLSKVQESFNTQLSPMGYEVEQLTWESGTPAIAGSAGTNYRINMLKLKLKQNRPLLDNKVVIDGTYCYHKSDSNGSLVVVDGSKRITVIVRPKGVTVSGTAVSWNATDNAEYRLYNGSTSDTDIKAEWKAGTYAKALAYTPVKGGITANSDGKRYDQTFSFNTIPEGSYKLVIVKPGHGLWIEELTVNTDNITDKSIRLYKMGDVNRDGKANSTDALWVRQSSAGGRVLDAYQKILADLNRDGKVNSTDALWIRQISAGSRTLTY